MNLKTISARDLKNKKTKDGLFVSSVPVGYHVFTCYWDRENEPIAKCLANNPVIYPYLLSLDSDVSYSVKNPNALKTDKEIKLPAEIKKAFEHEKAKLKASAGYIGNCGEHVIDLKTYKVGTHYDVNLLIGNRIGYPLPMLTTPKGSLDSLGRGSFRAGEAKQVTATRYNLHIEQNGEPCSRQIYITENGRLIFSSLDLSKTDSSVCRHYPNYTVIEHKIENLLIERTFFILPYEDNSFDAVESQIVKITDLSGKKRNLRVVFTGMFGLASPESQMNDIIYASVTWQGGVVKDGEKPVAVTPKPHPKYQRVHKRFATCVCDGEFLDEYATNYEEFVGAGDLLSPDSVNCLGNNLTMKVAPFYACEKNVTIEGNGSKNVISYTGYVYVRGGSDETFVSMLDTFLSKYKNEEACFSALDSVKKFMKDYSSFLKVKTNDPEFDKYVNYNLPFQVYYQAYVSRSFAWTQKAFREIGFREIQDMYASMNYLIGMGQTELVKSMMAQWIRNVYRFGYANHNFYQSGKQGGEYSDDALWLVQAVYRYISLTNDLDFLDEEFELADGDGKRKLTDTLLAIVKYSSEISVGNHGLPILDRADWNDCLKIDDDHIDGKTKEALYREQQAKSKKSVRFKSHFSESVMDAFLLKIALDELSSLLLMTGNKEKSKELLKQSKKLENNIQKYAWKDDYFARVLINRSETFKYLGAHDDGFSADEKINGTYFLNSFSWSILSGVATEEQIKIMLETTKKYLVTESGIKLCSPIALDRISTGAASDSYFPGDRENGGVFKHAEMMAACAFIRASGMVKDEKLSSELCSLASLALESVLPYKTLLHPFKTKGNPRFCTQYNNSISGEHIGPMLSGTASWLSLTLLELFGFECKNGYVYVSPFILEGFEEYEYTINLNGTKYTVNVKKQSEGETVGAFADGEVFSGCIKNSNDGKEHKIMFII